jgi:predicted enzyme related to lactoylglutathione lyase
MVDTIDKMTAKAEKPAGTIAMPKMEIKSVEETAVIMDTEGSTIGLWKPCMV